MTKLSKTLKYGLGPQLQDLAHQRVARACSDGAIRVLEHVTDEQALVPHESVVLVGGEIVGWITRSHSIYADQMFERELEVVNRGGTATEIEASVDFFVPSAIRWRDALVDCVRRTVGPLEVRRTMREAQTLWSPDLWKNFSEREVWSGSFALRAETVFGGLRICRVEREYGARGSDKGPRLVERFLAPPTYSGCGWWVALTIAQVERAREQWKAKMDNDRRAAP